MAIGTSVIMRIEMDKTKVGFGQIISEITNAGGDVVAIDVIRSTKETTTRDITINVGDADDDRLTKAVEAIPGVHVVNVSDRTFLVHLGGKIETQPKARINNRDDLSRVYTPGVARVCMAIHEDPGKAHSLTIKRNTVAVVSDGTAVLGLGDIGPEAAMPVMEGKAMLFKQLAGVDAFPICLDTKDTEEIIRTIKAIAPGFGGINLEDISSPRCFEIEERLKAELDIPVFHDDQHGTAVVMLAGLLNSLRLVGKPMEKVKAVLVGCGAAGTACSKILLSAGIGELICVDREGALIPGVTYEHDNWNWLAERTNPNRLQGGVSDVIRGADVFIGVSRPGVLTVDDVKSMARDSIVFAMANPEPEILPELAEPYVRVMATGRGDYPNQINNVLCFPGMFRGALDARATTINEEMKLAAAKAIASCVSDDELNETFVIPSTFNDKVAERISRAVAEAAIATGVARRVPNDLR